MDKNPFKLNNLLKNQSSITKFIINLDEDSTSGSENEEINKSNLEIDKTNKLKQDDEIDRNIAFKIQTSAIKNSTEKKRQPNNLKMKKQETDQHFNRLRKLINKKNLNVQQIRSKIVEKQLKLRKQQAHVKKLYNQYLTASEEMKNNIKEISSLSDSLAISQKDIESDKKQILALESKSKNLDKELQLYQQPNTMQVNKLTTEQLKIQQKESKLSTEQLDDNMSLDSSDEQEDLILEHNDTSLNKKDLVIQSTKQVNLNNEIIKEFNQKTVQFNQLTTQIKVYKTTIKSPAKLTESPKKKKPTNKKKNELLQKMLKIEERNEKEEVKNKLKLMNEKKEKDISELRTMLKNKQIFNNALIGLKKDIRNQLKLNDKIENFDLFVNGLSLFLDISLDKSYLLDNLTITIDNKLFDENLKKKGTKLKSKDNISDHSIYSNNLVQQQPDLNEYSLNGGVLESIRAYRLSNNFEEKYIKNNSENFKLVVDSFFTNKINPYKSTCNFDLNGKCNDDSCLSQHKKDFILNDRQKLIDLLLYNPSITRYKGKVETKEDMNGLLKHLNEFIDNLEKKYSYNELIKYLVKLIRISDDESIIIKTKVQMQQTENTIINEYISTTTTQQSNSQFNTFPDYNYNFKIRDRSNVLTYSKLINSNRLTDKIDDDSDSDQKRFFNFNLNNNKGKNLEDYCKDNPTDIRCWIKLAYLQLNSVNCKRLAKKQQLQNAIQILIKGLEENRSSVELWKTYIYLLINLLNCNKDENYEKIEKQLQFICKKILKEFSNYEIWKYYLSLTLNFLNKELISSEILDNIQYNKIKYYDSNNQNTKQLRSNAYLEIILYKVNLYVEINRIEKAKLFLLNILSASEIEPINISNTNEFIKQLLNLNQTEDERKKYEETSLLLNEDKVFLWLNYLYLIHNNKLPNEKFEPFKQGFCSIKNKSPFLIGFNSSAIKKSNLEKLLGILIESIKDCFFNFESNLNDYHQQAQDQIKKQMKQRNLIICLPLFNNLANLLFIANKKKAAQQIFNNISIDDNQLVELLINKSIFEEKNNYENEAFYTLGDNQIYKQDNFELIYYLCLLHFKSGEYKYFNYEVAKILNLFFEFDRSIPITISFKKLLYKKIDLDNEKQKLLDKLDSKLWVLYLMSEILAQTTTEENMDSVLYNSTSLSKLNKNTKSNTINLLHFLYLNFYAKTINDQKKLNEFMDKLQYALLFIEDQQFQFYLLKHFSNCFFSIQQRFKFFLKFLFIIPENKYVLNHFLNLAFNEMSYKKICYQVLKYFIERKRLVILFEPVHWFLIIYLAMEYKEHLNLHYYFQLAISNYPYNKQLWHYLLAYEVSQLHTEHINKIKLIIKNLKIPDADRQLIFD